MKIKLTSIFVNDQEKALRFYTGVLGFVKKVDIPAGDARWITVTSADDNNGMELLLEPDDHPAAKVYQKALFEDGIPAAAFVTDDIKADIARLKEAGVTFSQDLFDAGVSLIAVFDDTVGNMVQLYEVKPVTGLYQPNKS